MVGLNHVVTLQALDEDRLGEELTAVWELEVGHTITPDQGLPVQILAEGFDDPNVLAGFVCHTKSHRTWQASNCARPA